MVTIFTPACSARRASIGALSVASSQPSRILTVTGTSTAPTTASISDSGVVEVAHQRRAGIAAGHLLGRAAHVDVDDVGALARGDARGLGHVARLAAGKLHHMDRQAGMADARRRALPCP